MDSKNPFHPYTRPEDRDPSERLPGANEWELHQEELPSRADAHDQMSRRLSGTIQPEQPGNLAPWDEDEGEHAQLPPEPKPKRR
jgi:hypothetical protein